MSLLTPWEVLGEAGGPLAKVLRYVLFLVCVVSLVFFALLPLTWPQQIVLGSVMILSALVVARSTNSYLITLTLMLLSIFASFRYAWWRLSTVIEYLRDPLLHWGPLDTFFIVILVLAESYAIATLLLGYFQTIWPLRRAPVPMSDNIEEWPDVDLLIPTYNEPLSIVSHTALAALNIDWPAEKLHIYLLDDGRREEFRKFAEEAGIGYVTRSDNKNAKAGNINNALSKLHSPYVAIFDCDHVPTRSFLQVTMGWFFKDRKLSLVQTPHHFYSPDPFDRNLDQFRSVPNEEELFYGVVQDGNDFWNATFFCGSCAVMRREALDQIGGIATETVTEDAHTALRMQIKGWNTAYINIPQAAGLATERLSGHVTQRIRWSRGMVQIFRANNPLFARGLRWSQRVCYFSGMLHFFYALPRLIFLTAPLIYLLLGYSNIPGYWASILAYALPHLMISNITNSRTQGKYRHSFWNEVYETVLAPYILLPTLLALINPKLGKFNVTAKGGTVKEAYFDTKIAQPFFVLLLFNFMGLVAAILRFFIWDVGHPGTVLMNVFWVVFNIVILGVSVAVAKESQQRREDVRIDLELPATVRLPDGSTVNGKTLDVSSGGAAIRLNTPVSVAAGEAVHVMIPIPGSVATLPVSVVGSKGDLLRLRFENLSIRDMEQLTLVLYSRADSWLGWGDDRQPDRPMRSLLRIFRISISGLKYTLQSLFTRTPKEEPETQVSASRLASILLLLALLGGFAGGVQRAFAAAPSQPSVPAAVGRGGFHESFSLKDAGVAKEIEFRGLHSSHTVSFTVSDTHVVNQAAIHVRYRFSPTLLPQLSQLKLSLNGVQFATIEVPAAVSNGFVEQTIAIPSDLMVRNNELAFEFVGHYNVGCEDGSDSSLWSRVDNKSTIDLSGSLLPLADNLKLLPVPFLDSALVAQPSIPIAFLEPPSLKTVQAAGVVASYFGVIADFRPIRFPVTVGTIPAGNVVVLAPHSSSLPPSLGLSGSGAPTVAVRQNPNDPFGKVLVLTGRDEDQLLVAAQYLAVNHASIHGDTVSTSQFILPPLQGADAAPRWAQNDRLPLWDDPSTDALHSDGSVPLYTYFRLPPDLYYGKKQNLHLHLDYRYNSLPLGNRSMMVVRANQDVLGSLALPSGKEVEKTGRAIVAVPLKSVRPFSNSLSFEFDFQWPRTDKCQNVIPANMQGSILKDSYLDLTGVQHYLSMPNLEVFANAGFPFTKYADLHQTAVIMPKNPGPEVIGLFLSLMAHFGAQTGYPGLRVTVGDSSLLQKGMNRDLLVLGTAADQPAFETLSPYLPAHMLDGQVRLREESGVLYWLRHAWWTIRNWGVTKLADKLEDGTPSDTLIEGIESPYLPGRSIVLVEGKSRDSFDAFLSSFFSASQSSDISNSVSVLSSSGFKSYWVGENRYHIGHLPLWTVLSLWFIQVPWLVAFLVPPFCLLLASWLRIALRQHARSRLKVNQN